MTSSDSSKTPALKPAPQGWVKPVCALGGIVAVCGTAIYLVNQTSGAEMVRAMGPALVAVVALAK